MQDFSFGLGIWQLILLATLVLPLIALISVLKNEFKGNDKLILGIGNIAFAIFWTNTLFYHWPTKTFEEIKSKVKENVNF